MNLPISPQKPATGTSPFLPYSLQYFHVENFHSLHKTGVKHIPGNCRWVTFVGENGDGKTLLLQALAIGICGTRNARHLLDREDIRINAHFKVKGESQSRVNEISWNAKEEKWNEIEKPPVFFCGYGATRSSWETTDGSNFWDKLHHDPEANLLYPKGSLRNIESWLKEQKLISQEHAPTFERFNKVIKVLVSLLPNINKINIEGGKIFYWEKGYKSQIHQISHASRTLLSTIGDFLIRFFEKEPDEIDPANLSGIIVIDELELHLHPKFVTQLPQLLIKTFPKVQFICGTCSPMIVLGTPKDSKIFKVERDEIEGTRVEEIQINPSNILPKNLLNSSLFGFDSISSSEKNDFSSISTEISTEDSYNELMENMELEEKLREAAKEPNLFPKEWFEEDEEEK